MLVTDIIALGNKHARRRPRAGGPGGDQGLGQMKIEITKLHGRAITRAKGFGHRLMSVSPVFAT